VIAEYKPNKKAKNPAEFLANFKGYLHTDGYSAYHNLPDDIIVVGCWVKSFVISRNNFLFANTVRGANAAAVIFSLVETAKETGIDPFEYLSHVFKTAPNVDMLKPENIEILLPAGYKKFKLKLL